jgi:DNA-binding transcriptional ArsR family regulator
VPKRSTKGSAPGRNLSAKEISEARRRLESTPNLEKMAELLNVVGSSTRLKVLYLRAQGIDLPVGELMENLGGFFPAASQHLAKLRVHGLIAARRDGQCLHYRLTDHPFNEFLRASFFQPGGRRERHL